MFLSIKDLKKSFGEDEYKTEVLKGIDFCFTWAFRFW